LVWDTNKNGRLDYLTKIDLKIGNLKSRW